MFANHMSSLPVDKLTSDATTSLVKPRTSWRVSFIEHVGASEGNNFIRAEFQTKTSTLHVEFVKYVIINK